MSQTRFRELVALAKQIGNELRRMAEKLDFLRAEIHRLIHNAVSLPGADKKHSDKNKDATESRHSQTDLSLGNGLGIPENPPSPQYASASDQEKNKLLKWIARWKPLIEGVALILLIAYTTAAFLQWSAIERSNKLTEDALRITQRAYVTIGRKDGVVADFVVPKDPKQNAEIVVYFQNSGHLPAKFHWGTMNAGFLAAGSKSKSGISYTHPYDFSFIRTRDRKTGSVVETGESTIIAGDSVLVETLGNISQDDLAKLPVNNIGLIILGIFEYCDGLGNLSSRNFGLRYRSTAPSSSLSFDLAQDTKLPILWPTSDSKTEYLPPCETPDER